MNTISNEPHAWVILSGLRDFYKPPYQMHSANELSRVFETWKKLRESQWPKSPVNRHFTANWSQGKFLFVSPEMEQNDPVEGIVLYGTSPFDEATTRTELSGLGVFIAISFGQPCVELHFKGQIMLIKKDETNKPS